MPRLARRAPGGVIYHVLNRGVQRQKLFDSPDDFAAFLRVLHEVMQAVPMRVLGYCLMKRKTGQVQFIDTRAGPVNLLSMPRLARRAPGGVIYHVLNRGVQRQKLFDSPDDFAAFLRVLHEVMQAVPMRVLGYCLMSNHWHLVLWPRREGELARFMQRLTVTHVRRWVEFHRRVGWGSVYQGRYKSFAVQDDAHLLGVLRYVERNPLRANLVSDARRWRWSSLGQSHAASDEKIPSIAIADGPVARPADWPRRVNTPQSDKELEALRRSIAYNRPYGQERWTKRMESRLGLPPLRPRGRPRGERNRKEP